MSRTDRDAPYWTRAVWWAPLHRCAGLYSTQHPGHARLRPTSKPVASSTAGPWVQRAFAPRRAQCDLPAGPHLRHLPTHCAWQPLGERLPWSQDGPPRWYVLATWTRPQRARVRDECRRALQHHRATGTVDIHPTTTDHHHTARWDW
ncbi:hypothetical protein OHA72_41130 [Dactylosporangium sp. NBC_01737]|uniref:hypothetical protein n=1 Tax=Dactylosporangium sp. NBC_01737 TaxID=2975959 RepID=UPI002E0F2CF0|nr:hypothetical protein OHA72_41130 [Dactylosporangium sp. NBC_01737]